MHIMIWHSKRLYRLYAGIHYRSDCDTGLVTGSKVGAFAVQKAMTDGAE